MATLTNGVGVRQLQVGDKIIYEPFIGELDEKTHAFTEATDFLQGINLKDDEDIDAYV